MSKQNKPGAIPAPVKLSDEEQKNLDLGVQAIQMILEDKNLEFKVIPQYKVAIIPKK